jgi:hypothetical protein
MPEVLCTCGEYHDFSVEECLTCIPPREILIFGEYEIPSDYREELFIECPSYTVEEIVGSFIGENPYFLSYDEWYDKKNNLTYNQYSDSSDSDSDSDSSDSDSDS